MVVKRKFASLRLGVRASPYCSVFHKSAGIKMAVTSRERKREKAAFVPGDKRYGIYP